jgi:membrane-associated phospholipid phosphatase
VRLTISSLVRSPGPVDLLVIAFVVLLSLITLVFIPDTAVWQVIAPTNLVLCAVIIALSVAARQPRVPVLRFLHDWYPVPAIFLLFKEVYILIQSQGRSDIDQTLIAIDHALFGVHPTVWLTRFSFPLLTEILQLAYVSYYLLMLTLAIELRVRGDYGKFSFVIFVFVYGFFLSYLGYMIFPAVGPRFTLHSFDSLDRELRGLYFTDLLRGFINAGESIPSDVPNPLAVAQRDAFPSGHTEMTLLVIYYASRYRLRSRHVLYVLGTLLIISTVYLRYHYVVDLLGGVLFMAFTVWTAPKLFSLLQRRNAGE